MSFSALGFSGRFQVLDSQFHALEPTEKPGTQNLERRPMFPTVTVSARGEDRLRSGHPWVYKGDVTDARAGAGDVVTVRGPRGRPLGRALFSDRSQITLRLLSFDTSDGGEDVAALVRARLEQAIAFRAALAIDATAYRLVHGEADLLPSLVVDRYGDCLVVQTLSQGMDRLTPVVVSALTDLLQPRGILARNDPRARTLEGLAQQVEVLAGDVPPRIEVTELGVRYDVDVHHGQKTGLFLDQRENRAAAAVYARGRLLDCFSYHGGFALVLGPKCREAVAFDVSEDAVAQLRANAARNGVTVDARVGNVFDELRGLERLRERFDTIVLDPPAFAKNKAAVANARAGYKEINLRALKLLNPGGTLVTCSCSYHVNEAMLAEIVYEAAVDAQAHVTVTEKRMQGRDHPVMLAMPESYYLKCFILRKVA
jgi:23S rRNA (cytosine1962-C5)-methyltransferase